MDKTRKIIKNLLLAFVLISIGYALGKHSVKRPDVNGDDAGEHKESSGRASYVHVYYMHSTFRCASCNQIEKMTKELLASQFGKELKSGRIKFSEVDFQENEKLAKQFDIVSSCVVVAKVENRKTTDFKRLDEVWTLMNEPKKFDAYIEDAVSAYLPSGNENIGGGK